MSIVLTKFDKFPFEHFAWGQVLLYYNHVSMVTKDRILGKSWEAQLAMLATGKKLSQPYFEESVKMRLTLPE